VTSTERLRALLDERGIEWRSGLEGVTFVGDWCFVEYDDGKIAATCEPVLTPEQAIAATVGAEKRDTVELWPEWEEVLFVNVSDEVAQDNLNEFVHELLDKAATVGEESETHICKRCGVAYELSIIDKGFGKPRFCPNCGYKELYQ